MPDFRLMVLEAPGPPGWFRLEPRVALDERFRLFRGWRVLSPGQIEITWSGGFSGLRGRVSLQQDTDDLGGTVTPWDDEGSYHSTAIAKLTRIPCW
jgi:hypothetical protein